MVDLTQINENHAYIKRLKSDFEKLTGEHVVSVVVEKVKRIAGVSALPVSFHFDGGQVIQIFIKSAGNVVRAMLNGKAVAIVGDLNDKFDEHYDIAMERLANELKSNKSKFDKKRAGTKINVENLKKPSAKKSVAKQEQELAEQEKLIDDEIARLQAVQADLKNRLENFF